VHGIYPTIYIPDGASPVSLTSRRNRRIREKGGYFNVLRRMSMHRVSQDEEKQRKLWVKRAQWAGIFQ
jgi:hypothetical protein